MLLNYLDALFCLLLMETIRNSYEVNLTDYNLRFRKNKQLTDTGVNSQNTTP